MSWFARFFGLSRTDAPVQPATHATRYSDIEAPVELEAYAAPYSDIDDPLYIQAINFVLESKRTSISGIQHHLKIGYNRAARLIETMEFDGVVSSQSAGGARRLLSPEERSAYLLHRKVKLTSLDIKAEQKTLRRRSLPRPAKIDLPPLTGKIRGTKDLGFNIVGESHYQAALRKIRNSTCMAQDNNFEAFIVTEPDNPHDSNACAIYIDGYKVGYLPRDAAANYVDQIAAQGVHGISCFQIRAKLVGGFGDRLNIGVMVNLPTD
ncbi:DNA translocase FtsK [Pseudomonas frederiksbergensis]